MNDANRKSGPARSYWIPVALFLVGCLVAAVVYRYKAPVLNSLIEARRVPESRVDELEGQSTVSTVATTLTRLTRRVLGMDGALSLTGYGGGLAVVPGGLVGVDSRGQFFVYKLGEPVQRLDLNLDFNQSVYLSSINGRGYAEWWQSRHSKNVGVQGIAIRQRGDIFELYVCHDKWLVDEKAKVTVLSRLVIRDLEALLKGSLRVESEQWETVCEIGPVYPFSERQKTPFMTNHRGGRIVFDARGDLLLSIGDHMLDGVNDPVMSSQDPDLLQGKILKVDLETSEVSVFASGIRNSQGLLVDRDGVVWETEHGPKGGDELNRLVEGENYGWPLVTLGTDYSGFEWPLSENQGRHEGYAEPVFAWLPSIAVSNLIQVNDEPDSWDGDLLVSSLLAQSLFRVRLSGDRVTYVEQIRIGERVRDLVQLESGEIVLWTDAGILVELTETPKSEVLFSEPLTEFERSNGLGAALNSCAACHDIRPEQATFVAPSLWGIYGRRIGSSHFSDYSSSMKAKQGVWDEESLRSFLVDPQSFVPGTSMPPSELDEGRVALLIDYLRRAK